jgi:hypothetical protein
MPIRSYTRDDERQRITVVGDGPLTAADLIGVINRQIADNAWGYGLLYEATALPEAMDSLIVHLQEVAKGLGPRGPVAVVSRGPDRLNIARYLDELGTAGALALFSNRGSAEHWLDARLRERNAKPI